MKRVEVVADAIRDALARERQAIVTGRLDLIVRLAEHREALMRELGAAAVHSEAGVDAKLLAGLKGEMQRNQNMLSAAASGIKTVIDRIGDIRAAAGRLTTYNQDGLKKQHLQNAAQRRQLEHKA